MIAYGRKFDAPNLTAAQLQVSSRELQQAYEQVDEDFLDTLAKAIVRIQSFHEGKWKIPGCRPEKTGLLSVA